MIERQQDLQLAGLPVFLGSDDPEDPRNVALNRLQQSVRAMSRQVLVRINALMDYQPEAKFPSSHELSIGYRRAVEAGLIEDASVQDIVTDEQLNAAGDLYIDAVALGQVGDPRLLIHPLPNGKDHVPYLRLNVDQRVAYATLLQHVCQKANVILPKLILGSSQGGLILTDLPFRTHRS